jgi:hypothetical protein
MPFAKIAMLLKAGTAKEIDMRCGFGLQVFINLEDFNEYQKINADTDETGWIKKAYAGNQGSVSEMTKGNTSGTNTGFMISTGLAKDLGSLFHELTHGWGGQHDDVDSYKDILKTMPTSLPAGTKAVKYPTLSSFKKGTMLDETKRSFNTVDLNILFQHAGFKLNESKNGIEGVVFNKGQVKKNVGAVDNFLYDGDGFGKICPSTTGQ